MDPEKRGVPAGAGAAGSSTAFPLERMHALLAALGEPHKQLPVLHVAGSKGACAAAGAALLPGRAAESLCFFSLFRRFCLI